MRLIESRDSSVSCLSGKGRETLLPRREQGRERETDKMSLSSSTNVIITATPHSTLGGNYKYNVIVTVRYTQVT